MRQGLLVDPAMQHVCIDEISLALTRDEITLVDQLLVSNHHRVARHAEVSGHLAARWNRRVDGQEPIENRRNHHLPNLPLQAVA